MKLLAILFSLAMLFSCSKETTNITASFILPPDMQDCVLYELQDSNGRVVVITRCPNSTTSTTYKSGKHHNTSVVVDHSKIKAEASEFSKLQVNKSSEL